MNITEKYHQNLELVRKDFNLLENYRYVNNTTGSNHFERLRLNIAIYNDLKPDDFEIVKFLLKEEIKWRSGIDEIGDEDVYNLYFCAYILCLFNNPEIVWLFFTAKNIDFDSGIGFDGEYLVSAGIDKTYRYLETIEHPSKAGLLKYIGKTKEDCHYTQEDINRWAADKKRYFRYFEYPIQDKLLFLYSTNEKELFLSNFPAWISQERVWTYDDLSMYILYAKYSTDKVLQLDALKFAMKKDKENFPSQRYNSNLAELYIDMNEHDKVFRILNETINETGDYNIVRDSVGQICKLIIGINNPKDELSTLSYIVIVKQQEKYGEFSPMVEDLIKEAKAIME